MTWEWLIAFAVLSGLWFWMHRKSQPLVAHPLAFLWTPSFWYGEGIIVLCIFILAWVRKAPA